MKPIDLSQIDLNLLVLFDGLMRERHVGRTGKGMHLTASAVSHGLARLRRVLHDPLFLKHPKGVVPTDRANELAPMVSDILERVRGVVASAQGFDAKQSSRRFTIGAPDAVFAAIMPPLLAALEERAPNIDIGMRTLLPQQALAALDAREVDLAIQPLDTVPPRFHAVHLYDEDFAIAMRRGHPLEKKLGLDRYCAAKHVLVSMTNDPHGNVDMRLKELGKTRRIAATVPNFLLALAVVADTDLIAAVPRRLAPYARRLDVALVNPPSGLAPLTPSKLKVVATRPAMSDSGIAWLFELCTEQKKKAGKRT